MLVNIVSIVKCYITWNKVQVILEFSNSCTVKFNGIKWFCLSGIECITVAPCMKIQAFFSSSQYLYNAIVHCEVTLFRTINSHNLLMTSHVPFNRGRLKGSSGTAAGQPARRLARIE